MPFVTTLAGGGTACSAGVPEYVVSGTGKNLGDGCPATQSVINTPIAAVSDRLGNVFIGDQTDDLVRVVYRGGSALASAIVAANIQTTGLVPQPGSIYTVAGGVTALPASATTYYCNQQGSGPQATDRELNGCPGVQAYIQPRGLAVDADGNVFISNLGTASQISIFYVGGAKAAALIAVENPTLGTPQPGFTYKIAGTTYAGYAGDGALASKAAVSTPRGLYVDANENVYFADTANNVIRRVDGTSGIVTTVAGHCALSGSTCTTSATAGDGQPATSSSVAIDTPYGVAVDGNGNLFIAEGGTTSVPGRIRVVYAAGSLPGLSAPVPGVIYTYAGAGTGSTPALAATFQLVYGVSIDMAGYLYVTDYRSVSTGSNKIWRVDPATGNIAAVAGTGGSALVSGARCNGGATGPTATDTRGDGCPATEAYLNSPQESYTSDAAGNYYIADRGNNVIRAFSLDNVFKATALGSSTTQQVALEFPAGAVPAAPAFSVQGAPNSEFADAGSDTCSAGVVLVGISTCVYNVKFSPATAGARFGSLSIAGSSAATSTFLAVSGEGLTPVTVIDPGVNTQAGSGLQPVSVAVDGAGDVYVGDAHSQSVLEEAAGSSSFKVVATVSGSVGGAAVDSFGDVFVADTTSGIVIEVQSAARGGSTVQLGSGWNHPEGLATDGNGTLYVADSGNNRIVSISPLTGEPSVINIPGVTLSVPSAVAVDSTGNLLVLDTNGTRVVTLPISSTAVVTSLPSGVQGTAIATDPAGDLYVTDKASGNVLLFAGLGNTPATIAGGYTSPAGVAVSASGNVYVADSASTSLSVVNRSQNATTFPTTNIGLTSLPSTLTLRNEGTAPGTLNTPLFTAAGSSAAFPLQSVSTCASGAAVTVGASCNAVFAFQPTTPGAQSASLNFGGSSAAGPQAVLSATATNLILTSIVVSLTPATATTYGQALTANVVLTPSRQGTSAPSGTVQLFIDGTLSATQTVSGTQYTFPLALGVGTHAVSVLYSGDALYAANNATVTAVVGKAATTLTSTYAQTAAGTKLTATLSPATVGAMAPSGAVSFAVDGKTVASTAVQNLSASATVLVADGSHTYNAVYSGDANYQASSSASGTLTVARTPTTLSLTVLPVSQNGTAILQLAATVQTAGSSGIPSGSITLTNAGTTLGTMTLSAGSPQVTFTTSSVNFSSYAFTASYSGDGLFQPATVTITEGPDFAVVTPTTSLGVPQGGSAVESVSVVPINGYSGTITPSCTGLPANSLCRFLPTAVSLTAGSSSTLSVQVFAGTDPNLASLAGSSCNRTMCLVTLISLLLGCTIRRKMRGFVRLSAALVLLLVGSVSTGCGNKTPAYPTATFVTPVGTSVVTVTLTDMNGMARSATFTMQVNSN